MSWTPGFSVPYPDADDGEDGGGGGGDDPGAVDSVNGYTGAVVLDAVDVGAETAAGAQAKADAKVAQTVTDGVTTSAPSQNVVFDQLTLKAPTANPTFTGTVTIPDAALSIADTSGLQTALNAKAADADVVHDTGDETIAGVKTFSSDPLIPDEAYGSGWNGVLEPPTKNALYDKIETLGAGTSTEDVQDIVGAMVSGGTETGIAVSYDDTNARLDFVAEVTQAELDLKANAANPVFTGTVTIPDAALAIADTSGLQTALNTIPNTEAIQDIVGGMVVGGTETGIAVSYDDTNARLDFVAEVTQAELDLKANAANPVFTGTVTIPDAALAIADTSGLQTALDAKAPTANPTFTGTVTIPDAALAIADTSGLQTALDAKETPAGAQAKADAKVTQTITNGTTTTAPSEDAVFDALALKAPAANPTFTGTVTIPDGALAIADTSGLQAALDAKAADSAVVHDTGNETGIAGNKEWTGNHEWDYGADGSVVIEAVTADDTPKIALYRSGDSSARITLAAGNSSFTAPSIAFTTGAGGTAGLIVDAGVDISVANRGLSVNGKTGATATPMILAGGTASGAPASGAHLKGELVRDDAGVLWTCTVAGTPGTWVAVNSTLLAAKADLASPALTGTPTAPTAAVDTDTTQIATTAYVIDQIASTPGGTTEVFVDDPEDPGTYVQAPLYIGETDPAIGGDDPYAWLNPYDLGQPTDYVRDIHGGQETVDPTTGNTGATETLDVANGNVFVRTQDQACTYTFATPESDDTAVSFTLILTAVTGAATWPAAVNWPSGTAPTLTGRCLLTFITVDGGTVWDGFLAGSGMA